MLFLLMLILSLGFQSSAESHCRRYRSCISSARNDYELCVGGVAAAIIGDYETPDDTDIILKHSGAVAECENRNFAKIMEYKAIRRLEEDDMIKCTDNTDSETVSEVKKLACMGTPVTWSLQELARGVVHKPSQCRELYIYQLERCVFLGSCCTAHGICMTNVSDESLAYQQRLQRGHTIKESAKACLESVNSKYDKPEIAENQKAGIERNLVPGFKQPISSQQKRIEQAINEARAQVTVSTGRPHTTKAAPTIMPTLPTLPTLPTFPNLFQVLFPGLTTTAPPSTTTITTPHNTVSRIEKAKKDEVKTEFSKDFEKLDSEEEKGRFSVEENKKLCQEALKCESKIREYKLECGKKHIQELMNPISHAGYSDFVVLKELLQNIQDNETSPAVRKSCIHPLLANHSASLVSLLNEMDKKHSFCTEKSSFYKKSIEAEEKERCLAISTDIIFEEMTYEKRKKQIDSKNLETSFEACVSKIEFATKKCEEAKRCCPGYNVCTKLMFESEISQNYKEKLKEVKKQQKECEVVTLSNLSSVQPGFVPYFH